MNERISNIQNDLKETASHIWLAGLGAFTVASEEGNKLFSNLVEKGASFENGDNPASEGVKKTVGTAKDMASDVANRMENALTDKVAVVLQKMGVPTREEIQQLNDRVDALVQAVTKMAEKTAETKEQDQD